MIAPIITLIANLASAVMIFRAGPAVRDTSLTAAWVWAVVAACGWCLASGSSLVFGQGASAAGQLWYVAAVLTLCPWIAVLGGRRPTVRVWNWFVVVPLVAVLLWPVALCWMPRGPDRLQLETPHLVGFALVLLMGTGNYAGTRFGGLAFMTVLSQIMLLAAIDPRNPAGRTSAWFTAVAGCVEFNAVLAAVKPRSISRDEKDPWSRLWSDFRNTFGIVWANRIAERVNAEATKGNWPVRLQGGGFVSVTGQRPPDLTTDSPPVEQTLRWLLRRFVDESWIDSRLKV